MSNNRLTKKIFLYDYNIKHNNWSSEIENILESVNLLIHKMPKLRTYVLFKHEYKTEEFTYVP